MPSKKEIKMISTLLTLLIALVYSLQSGELQLGGFRQGALVVQTDSSTYPVLRVVDGDTIDIEKGGEKVRLRLIGVNSPESVDPRRPVECFGKAASRYADGILSGQLVSIETDPSQGEFDKYKRLLAYVYLPDGRSFNLLMIKDGYAHEYTYHTPYKYQREYKEAEKDAQVNQRGLWSTSTCSGASDAEQK